MTERTHIKVSGGKVTVKDRVEVAEAHSTSIGLGHGQTLTHEFKPGEAYEVSETYFAWRCTKLMVTVPSLLDKWGKPRNFEIDRTKVRIPTR